MSIVENNNTSYIDSLFTGLFYSNSIVNTKYLNSDQKNNKMLYLQEMIKYNFIELLRTNKSILIENINNIRNYLLYHVDYSPLYDYGKEQNVFTLFDFLTMNLCDSFISLSLNITDTEDITVNELLLKNYKKIKDIPNIVGIKFIRNYNNKILKTKIDIKEKIRLDKKDGDLGNIKWNIHSLICMKDSSYYSIFLNNNKWYIFNNKFIPCIQPIDLSNKIISDKIKSEVMFAMYYYYY